jgi:hypothetical protein
VSSLRLRDCAQAELTSLRERAAIAQSGLEQVDVAIEAGREQGVDGMLALATRPDAAVSPSFQVYLRKLLGISQA